MAFKRSKLFGGHAAPLLFCGLALLLASCATAPTPPITGALCDFGDVVIDGSFEGGRVNGCKKQGRRYVVAIRPESTPINPSPWFAFDVASETKDKVTITLDYGEFEHRYSPDIWTVAEGWRPYGGDVKVTEGGALATFRLDLPEDRKLRIAAQPILLPDETYGWMEEIFTANPQMTLGILGASAESRSIPYLESGADLDRWVLLLGRQHPPETTGAVAMEAFMKRISADDALASRFREKVGFLSIPMLNPDGVVAGNWRHDSTGKDLNRDWGPFEKPETQLVRDAISARVSAGRQLMLGLDFHSTKKDVLYTQPDGEDDAGNVVLSDWFAPAWHEAINDRISDALPGEPPMVRDGGHNPESPTFKTWINVAYNVPGITVEFGDETRPERLRLIGEIAAEEMMRLFLSDAVPE